MLVNKSYTNAIVVKDRILSEEGRPLKLLGFSTHLELKKLLKRFNEDGAILVYGQFHDGNTDCLVITKIDKEYGWDNDKIRKFVDFKDMVHRRPIDARFAHLN